MPAKLSMDERIERFWSRSERVGDCLIWQGGRGSGGYGKVGWTNRESCYTHRIAWMLTYGEMPKPPLQVLHKCGNKSCIEPKHLYAGTQKENVRDAINDGKFHMGPSHWFYNKNLTEEIRSQIVEEYKAGASQSELGRKYGMSQAGIGSITRKAGIDGTDRFGTNAPKGKNHYNYNPRLH